MPEMHFIVRWPDGSRDRCYSPSLVVKEHMEAGAAYPLADFVDRSRTALKIASDRVKARYGFACSLAEGQLARIERTAARFADAEEPIVAVEAFED